MSKKQVPSSVLYARMPTDLYDALVAHADLYNISVAGLITEIVRKWQKTVERKIENELPTAKN